MKHITLIFIFLLLFLPDRADSLRCGSDLVLKGYKTIEVLKKCGEPEFKEEWEEETVTHITDEKNKMSRDLMIGTES